MHLKKTKCICCEKKRECIEIESKKYKNYFVCKKCLLRNREVFDKDTNNIEIIDNFVNNKKS